jgi:hypothetical protein
MRLGVGGSSSSLASICGSEGLQAQLVRSAAPAARRGLSTWLAGGCWGCRAGHSGSYYYLCPGTASPERTAPDVHSDEEVCAAVAAASAPAAAPDATRWITADPARPAHDAASLTDSHPPRHDRCARLFSAPPAVDAGTARRTGVPGAVLSLPPPAPPGPPEPPGPPISAAVPAPPCHRCHPGPR